jgi:hypothetical protein
MALLLWKREENQQVVALRFEYIAGSGSYLLSWMLVVNILLEASNFLLTMPKIGITGHRLILSLLRILRELNQVVALRFEQAIH